jgi:hypothetical protein
MKRLALVTCVWKRHAITRVFYQAVDYLRDWWQDEVDLVVVVAGSQDPVHAQLATAAGAVYLDVPNHPLGAKFQSTLTAARTLDVDAVLIMGSDDLLDEPMARAYLPILRGPEPCVGLRDWYFLQTEDGRFGYWPGYAQRHRLGEPAGGGRIIPVRWLDALNWQLWETGKHHGMDHSSYRRLSSVGMPTFPLLTASSVPGCALGLKGPDSLWRYEHVGPHRAEDKDTVLGRFPPDIREPLLAMRHRAPPGTIVEDPALIFGRHQPLRVEPPAYTMPAHREAAQRILMGLRDRVLEQSMHGESVTWTEAAYTAAREQL